MPMKQAHTFQWLIAVFRKALTPSDVAYYLPAEGLGIEVEENSNNEIKTQHYISQTNKTPKLKKKVLFFLIF